MNIALWHEGVVGTALGGHALALTLVSSVTKAGPLPSDRVVRRDPHRYYEPLGSRCTAADFAIGLYDAPCPDEGHADGSPVFRTSPCTRAALRTPPRSSARFGTSAVDVAFAVT